MPDALDVPEDFGEILARFAPGFRDDADTASYAQKLLARDLIATPDVPRPVRLICTLAASDLGDLLDDVLRGAGRSAMRAARSLIEHQVNLHTVLHSPEAADRYMAHLAQGPLLLSGAPDAFFLTPAQRRSATHAATRRARASERAWEEALAKYGRDFRRQWHPTSIRDRSVAAGREDLYDMYRFGSAVAHGSSAGSLGHFSVDEADVATYAIGRVPTLVPLAFAIGTEAYCQLLVHLHEAHPTVEVDAYGRTIHTLLERHSSGIYRACTTVAPAELAPSRPTAHLAFSPRGTMRWYASDPHLPGRWYRAVDAPVLRVFEDWLAPVMAAYVNGPGAFNAGNLAAIEVPQVAAIRPDFLSPTVPDDIMPAIVLGEDGSWAAGRRTGGREFEVDWVVHAPLDLDALMAGLEAPELEEPDDS